MRLRPGLTNKAGRAHLNGFLRAHGLVRLDLLLERIVGLLLLGARGARLVTNLQTRRNIRMEKRKKKKRTQGKRMCNKTNKVAGGIAAI